MSQKFNIFPTVGGGAQWDNSMIFVKFGGKFLKWSNIKKVSIN